MAAPGFAFIRALKKLRCCNFPENLTRGQQDITTILNKNIIYFQLDELITSSSETLLKLSSYVKDVMTGQRKIQKFICDNYNRNSL